MEPLPPTLHLRVPGLPDWIEPTVDHLVSRARADGDIAPDRARRLMTALHEAITNAVVHGSMGVSSGLKERGDDEFLKALAARCSDPEYARRVVDVVVGRDERFVTWTITDEGGGFDAEAALRRLDVEEPDATLASGRGLMMMRAFVDELRYDDKGRKLTLGLRRRGGDQRASERRHLMRNVTVVTEDGEAREALLRNVSPGGAALMQADPAPAGRVMVTIPTPGGPVSLFAEVRHWHEVGDRVIEVGCRFDEPVSLAALGVECLDDESGAAVAGLVRKLAEAQRPPAERRSAPRVAFTEPIKVEAAGRPAIRAHGRDLSRGGLSFFATGEVPLGMVTLSLPAGESCLRLRAKVVRCTRLIDGVHEVAARFVAS